MNILERRFEHWSVYTLKNEWLNICVVPQIGGRILQIEMGGYPFLFVNEKLLDYPMDCSRLGPENKWLNFGGEKIWPAPQGWSKDTEWPGPPDPVLDSGEYSCDVDPKNTNRLVLQSADDPFTGLRITKEISLDYSSARLRVKAVFTNLSLVDKTWSIWPVMQMNTNEADEGRYRVVCPIKENSRWDKGYKVMHGLVNNPQVTSLSDNLLEVRYQYLVGKIGMDTDAGWLAYVDIVLGKVLVLFYDAFADGKYPEDTSIQLWTAGQGLVYSRSVITPHVNDKDLNPPYLEMEVLSPLKSLRANESMSFSYEMATCSIPQGMSPQKVSVVAVIAQALNIEKREENTRVWGYYGVFQESIISVTYQSDGVQQRTLFSQYVTPLHGVTVDFVIVENDVPMEGVLLVQIESGLEKDNIVIDRLNYSLCRVTD